MANIPSGFDSYAILGVQADYDTLAVAATAGRKIAIVGEELDGTVEQIQSDSFSGDANSKDAVDGDVDAGGTLRHNLTLETAPLFAKAICRSFATAGAPSDYTHTIKTGSGALPAYTIEVPIATDVANYKLIESAVLDTKGFEIRNKGFFQVQLGYVGKKADTTTTPHFVTPDDWTGGTELHHRLLAAADVKLDGAAVGRITRLQCNIANDVDREVRQLGSDGERIAAPAGTQKVTGAVDVYFDDPATFFAKTAAGVYVAFDFTWTISATRSMQLVLPRVKLQRQHPKASTPKSVMLSLPFVASKDSVEATQIKFVIKNGIVGTKY